jgi:hypothetical protein
MKAVIAALLLALFVGSAFAQGKPTPSECKTDPARPDCQK